MAKRYGRNQRRKHREEMKLMHDKMCEAIIEAQRMTHKAHYARQEALDYFMNNTGLVKETMHWMMRELGQAVGKELAPYAQKLFEHSMHQQRDLCALKFSLDERCDSRPVKVLRAEIRPFIFNMVLQDRI